MFLAWFGGIGFLATTKYGIGLYLALVVASVGGTVGGGIVYWFLKKVLSYENPLDPADFEMVGVVGRLSNGIRDGEDGHGELTYEQQGVRMCCGARSENGTAIEKESEVVITDFKDGIAIVKRWEEFTGM